VISAGADVNEATRLCEDAQTMGLALSEPQSLALLRLLDELTLWNRTYNLTSITAREAMISAHLLDSLSAQPELTGKRIADVGTGAGFPGLPLALVEPQRQFTLIDSVAKKIRFVSHAARVLELANVAPLQARVETLAPATAFDTVMARAYAALPDLLGSVRGLCGSATRVVALKGRYPQDELDELPRGWRLASARVVSIPRLQAKRHILSFVPQPL
jgi:16S rRNA (guanine527-N7)-methyltransferase